MAEGVDGLLRDKTRPSRIAPLDPSIAPRAWWRLRSARRPAKPPTGRRTPWPSRSASAPVRCGGYGAATACNPAACVSSSCPTIHGVLTSCATLSAFIAIQPIMPLSCRSTKTANPKHWTARKRHCRYERALRHHVRQTPWFDDPRRYQAWHHHPVRGAERAGWHRDRPMQAAAAARAVHPLPQRRRA